MLPSSHSALQLDRPVVRPAPRDLTPTSPMSDTTITFLVLGAVVVVFVLDRFPVALVAVATSLALWATGVLDLNQALAGFGDPVVLFIASLFVVSESLDATGVTAWAGAAADSRVGESRTRLLVLTMPLVALTALISVNGAVAALLPMVVLLAMRLRRSPGQLLLPLAFARARRLAADADRLAGERDRVRRGDRRRVRLLRVRARRHPARLGTIAIVVLFGERCSPSARDTIPRPQRARADARRAYGSTTDALNARAGVAEVVTRRARASSARPLPGMVTESGDFVVLAVQRRARTSARRRSRPATRCSSAARGWRSSALDDPDVLVVDAPGLVRAGPARARREARARRARRDGRAARDGSGPAGGRGPAGRGRAVRSADGSSRPTARSPGRRSSSSPGCSRSRPRSSRPARRRSSPRARRHRRRRGRLCAARRAVRADGGARPADQQHGHGADRDPDRIYRRRRTSTSRCGRC